MPIIYYASIHGPTKEIYSEPRSGMIGLAKIEIHTEFKPIESIAAELQFPILVARDLASLAPDVAEHLARERIAEPHTEIDHAMYLLARNNLPMRHLM